MLKKLLFIGLVCIGVMAFMVSQASAGCCCSPYTFCAWWLGGSVDSYHTASVRNYPAGCEAEGNCPETRASVFGVIPPEDNPDVDCADFDPDGPYNQNCLMRGKALCNNPANKKPRNFPKGTAVPYYYSGAVTTGYDVFECNKNGRCKELLTIPFDEIICKAKWVGVDFTAEQFIGVQDMCTGGFDDAGVCCATPDRVEDSSGSYCGEDNLNPGVVNDGQDSVLGKPNRYVKVCYKDLTDYEFGDSFSYCCAYCDPVPGGGYTCPDIQAVQAAGQCIE